MLTLSLLELEQAGMYGSVDLGAEFGGRSRVNLQLPPDVQQKQGTRRKSIPYDASDLLGIQAPS